MKKILTLIAALVLLTTGSSAQSTNQNYVKVVLPQQAIDSPSQASAYNALVTIQYFDGLGRNTQTVQQGANPHHLDVVSITEYNGIGKEEKIWNPISTSSSNGAFQDINTAKNTARSFYDDQNPYTQLYYESSPLQRKLGSMGPGSEWQTANKKILIHPQAAIAQGIKKYVVAYDRLTCKGSYTATELQAASTTDEDGYRTTEFYDVYDRKVMQRKSRGTEEADTYFVYDNRGNLCYVLPPMLANLPISTAAYPESADSPLDLYAYIYRFDNRKRCIAFKPPGADWKYSVYDKADRLVLSQTGVQREKGEWLVYKYNVFGELLYKGVMTDRSSRADLQNTCNNLVVTETYTGSNGFRGTGYTENHFTGKVSPLLVNYYDNYTYLDLYPTEKPNLTAGTSPEDFTQVDGEHLKTLPTGTRTYHLDDHNRSELCAYYYDKYGRQAQVLSTNHLGGNECVYYKLDFTGKPLKMRKLHNIYNKPIQTEDYKYEYDHGGRPTKTYHKINSQPEVMFSEYAYDDIGRFRQKMIHNYSDDVIHTYNVRNWPTKIESQGFTEYLYYNKCDLDIPNPFESCYNGNIARSVRTSNGDTYPFSYYYDYLNRLKAAYGYNEKDPEYSEDVEYDANGNLTSICRESLTVYINFNQFEFKGNQLLKASGRYLAPQWFYGPDWQRFNGEDPVQYRYDKNGNMTYDVHSRIVDIKYNVLNLPDTVVFSNGKEIRNTYDAAGHKLRSTYVTPLLTALVPNAGTLTANAMQFATSRMVSVSIDDYCGNYLYKNGVNNNDFRSAGKLEQVLTPEGYLSDIGGDLKYNYFRKDHLGSTCEVISFTASNGTRKTEQVNWFYPSGVHFQDGVNTSAQAFKFTGKEFIGMHYLNQYDFTARYYNPSLMRFTTMDPMAEKYYDVSPYAYCNNNPIRFVDPDGKQVIPVPLPLPLPIYIPTNQPFSKHPSGQELIRSINNGINNAELAIKRDIVLLKGLMLVSIHQVKQTVSSEYKHQQREDKRAKEQLDLNQANMAKSIQENTPSPTPDGNSDPKRELTPKGKAVLIGASIVKIIEEMTNPNPSKDAHEAHIEKANEKMNPNEEGFINGKKVYEMENNWRK